ncbi:unnamed protein product [Lactuca saligna]|uniref:Uncharacterized protein n=1 Tax=Lactuca saligna TaxID=75948 RepID=A0AA35ZDL0_LACSI|nr:unnamed protein product [Lactuca saligna]
MLSIFKKNLRRLCSKFRWPMRRRSKPKVIIKRFGKLNSRTQDISNTNGSATIHPNNHLGKSETPIRIATFNAALFSMAPVVPELNGKASSFDYGEDEQDYSSKQSPLHSSSSMSSSETVSKQHKFAKSKLRVSINLPDNEISPKRSRQLSFAIDETKEGPSSKTINSKGISRILKGKGVLRSQISFSSK